MIVMLKVPPDIEATLLAKAEAEGKPVSDYIQGILRRQVVPENGLNLPAYQLPYDEWLVKFHAFLEKNSGNTVVLPDEAYDRESIYGDHGA